MTKAKKAEEEKDARTPKTIRFKPDVLAEAEELAEADDRSLNSYVGQAVGAWNKLERARLGSAERDGVIHGKGGGKR